jgi:hypothetical protein
MVLTGGVKRVFRSLWILAANGILIRLLFSQLFGEPFNRVTQSPELWLEFLLKAIVPVLGIVLELAGWRFARWVNVGYFTLLGFYYCAGAAWWWSDPFHGVLLIMGLGLLIIAGLTELIYRITENPR